MDMITSPRRRKESFLISAINSKLYVVPFLPIIGSNHCLGGAGNDSLFINNHRGEYESELREGLLEGHRILKKHLYS